MGGINITYETLFDIVRNEKKREELQKLPETFFQDLVQYIQDKSALLTKSPDSKLFADAEQEKTKKQLANIKKFVNELYDRREKKLVNLALISVKTNSLLDDSALLDEEKQILEALIRILEQYRGSLLQPLLVLNKPNVKAKQTTNISKTVRFLQPVPKFVGKELEVYGPFDEEDVANLPIEIANLLIEKSRAEEIKS